MNILFLIASELTVVCRGGIERSTENCAREMLRRGHNVRILAWIAEKDPSLEFSQLVFPNNKPRNTSENRKLFSHVLRENKVDIVVFQCGVGWKFPFPQEIRESGIPLITVIHSVPNSYEVRYKLKYSGFSRWWNTWTKRWRQTRKYRFNYDISSSTVVLVQGLVPALERFLTDSQISQRKIDVIWNFASFRKSPVDFSNKKKELLFVGRMSFVEKRPDLLLKVWAKLQSEFPDWRLRFVGDGEYLPELKSLAEVLGLARVCFDGFQNPESYYRDASIFCMTSAYEGFPMTLLEAGTYGCVPVVFDSFSAVRDIIADGETGRIVPAFDIDEYSRALASLMGNDNLRIRLAKNVSAQIPEKFSPEKIGDSWEKLFCNLVQESRG